MSGFVNALFRDHKKKKKDKDEKLSKAIADFEGRTTRSTSAKAAEGEQATPEPTDTSRRTRAQSDPRSHTSARQSAIRSERSGSSRQRQPATPERMHVLSQPLQTPERMQVVSQPLQTPGLSQGFQDLHVGREPTRSLEPRTIEDILRYNKGRPTEEQSSNVTDDTELVFLGTKITLAQWKQSFALARPARQRELTDDFMVAISAYYDNLGDFVTRMGEFFLNDAALMEQYNGKQTFLNMYQVVGETTAAGEKKRKELSAALSFVKQQYPRFIEDCVKPHHGKILMSNTGMSNMQTVLRRLSLRHATLLLNRVAVNRIRTKGRNKDRFINVTDWGSVVTMFKDIVDCAFKFVFGDPQSMIESGFITNEEVQAIRRAADKLDTEKQHLQYSSSKLLPNTRSRMNDGSRNGQQDFWTLVWDVWIKADDPRTELPKTIKLTDELCTELGIRPDPTWGLIIPAGDGGVTRDEIRALGASSPAIARKTIEAPPPATVEETEQQEQDQIAEGEKINRARELAVGRMNTLSPGPPTVADLPFPGIEGTSKDTGMKETSIAQEDAGRIYDASLDPVDLLAEDNDTYTDREVAELVGTPCKCSDPNSIFVSLINKTLTQHKLQDHERVRVINAWYQEVNVGRVPGGTVDIDRICRKHALACGKAMGIYKNAMKHVTLCKVLCHLYMGKEKWPQFQSDPVVSILFRKPFRNLLTPDDLVSYKYRPNDRVRNRPFNWEAVIDKMGRRPKVDEYKKDGNIIVDCFGPLFGEEEFTDCVNDQFSMYRWHLREIDGKSNKGWNRIMYHSLIQQLVRSDLEYWSWYPMLRPDHGHTLVSYPYYTKDTRIGDETEFRHIDLNISAAVDTGLGSHMVQGSMACTTDDRDNCTLTFDGFHKIIGEWLAWARSDVGKKAIPDSSGKIQAWDDSCWPPELATKYPKLKMIRTQCEAGACRISSPLLPHGSTGPATKERRTILPWYVLVTESGAMEVPSMGTYDEIAAAHRDLRPAPRTPSGHPNMYGGIRWAFPADVHLEYRSWIQKAIVCQVPWSDPRVVLELNKVFRDGTKEEIKTFMATTRSELVKQMLDLWKEVVPKLEIEAYSHDTTTGYPSRSYFEHGEGEEPAKGDNWTEYSGAYNQEDAINRLIGQLDMEEDEIAAVNLELACGTDSVDEAVGSRRFRESADGPAAPTIPDKFYSKARRQPLRSTPLRTSQSLASSPLSSPGSSGTGAVSPTPTVRHTRAMSSLSAGARGQLPMIPESDTGVRRSTRTSKPPDRYGQSGE